MADYAVYPNASFAAPRGKARASAGRAAARKAGFPFAAAAVLFAAACLAAAAFAVSPAMAITRFEAVGTSLPASELARAAGVGRGLGFFAADCEGMARALCALPVVAQARVERVFPNGLRFVVVERAPVAVALVETETGVIPAAIDASGVVFADARGLGRLDLPVISGIGFRDFRYGVTLPEGMLPMLESLAGVSRERPELLSILSELKPVARAHGEFDYLVYPLAHRTPVRTGASLSCPLLQSMALVLDVVESGALPQAVGELDFRSGTVVYRLKEGVSG